MKHRLARLALPLTAAGLAAAVFAGCGAYHPHTTGRPAAVVAWPGSRTTSASSTTIAVPASPWQPTPAAIATAEQYVTAALSYTWTQPPQAWIGQVTPICTPQWVAELRDDADGGTGGWAAITTGHATAAAQVLAVYPSAGPGPGQRLEVTARVTRTGRTGTTTAATAMFVDLLPQPDGRWLIGWAG